jgi:pyruvate dehydrogenase (quinone)
LEPVYTDLKNPDFGEVAKAIGLWGRSVSKAGDLEEPVQSWLPHPGPAVLHVEVKPMQLVTPPSPFHRAGGRHWDGGLKRQSNAARQRPRRLEMIVENIP